jgi:ribosomal protein S18 acetylase RimI-like enzyme
MRLEFPRVQPFDLPALVALAEHTFRTAWEDTNDPVEFERYCRENFTEDNFRDELAAPESEFYFARNGDRDLGYLKINLNTGDEGLDGAPALQIERIYVLSGFQGQGIGERLLALAEERARESRAAWLWLSVWQEAPRSIHFYRRNGFEIFGTHTFWLGQDPQMDWLMKRPVLIQQTSL